LSEEFLIDMFETICSDKEWSGYGIKEVDGVKRIVYPGSEVAEVPGIMQGGGPWPRRWDCGVFRCRVMLSVDHRASYYRSI